MSPKKTDKLETKNLSQYNWLHTDAANIRRTSESWEKCEHTLARDARGQRKASTEIHSHFIPKCPSHGCRTPHHPECRTNTFIAEVLANIVCEIFFLEPSLWRGTSQDFQGSRIVVLVCKGETVGETGVVDEKGERICAGGQCQVRRRARMTRGWKLFQRHKDVQSWVYACSRDEMWSCCICGCIVHRFGHFTGIGTRMCSAWRMHVWLRSCRQVSTWLSFISGFDGLVRWRMKYFNH